MKVEVQQYKKSLNETKFTAQDIAIIWDFYVTKSIAKTCSQRRQITSYGWAQVPWKEMKEKASLSDERVKILLANTINNTLANFDLITEEGSGNKKHNKPIEIDTIKIVCSTTFKIADEENPKPSMGEAESVLTHIRNSFAHGCTYFFDNDNVLLEDKDKNGIITARMILKQQTLLDWIYIIDKEKKYYGNIERNIFYNNI